MIYFNFIIVQLILTFLFSFFILRGSINLIICGSNTPPHSSSSFKLFISYVILLIPIIYLYFNTFYLLSYRHSDAIGYLNSFIGPLVFSGRFQPLALQELNILRYLHLDTVFFQYSLSFLSFFIFLIINWKILAKLNIVLRAMILSSMCSLPFIQEVYSSTIFAEAEALIFISMGILAYKYYVDENKFLWGVVSLISFALALYYKETNFLFVVGFSISIIFGSILKEIRTSPSLSNVFFLKNILFNNSYAIINIINSFVFLIAYWFFVYRQMPADIYLPSYDFKPVFYTLVFDSPIIPIYSFLFIMGIQIVSVSSRILFFNLLTGGLLFLIGVLFILEMPHNSYYYYLSYFSVFVAFGIYLSEMSFFSNLKNLNKFLIVFGVCVFFILIKFEAHRTYQNSISAKKYQYSNLLLKSSFDLQVPDKKIFFKFEKMRRDYAIYRAGVFTESLKQTFPDAAFNVVALEGCSSWISNDNVRCEVGDHNKYEYDYFVTQNINKPDFIDYKYNELTAEIKFFLFDEIAPSIKVYERDF